MKVFCATVLVLVAAGIYVETDHDSAATMLVLFAATMLAMHNSERSN